MSDIKITALAESTTPVSTDLVLLTADPSGTAVSKKLELSNLSKGLALGVGLVTATSHTFTLSQANNFIRFNNASTQTITIPTHASVAIPAGSRIWCLRQGNGAVTFTPATGVTIVSLNSNLSISGTNGVALLVKISSSIWSLSGDLA